MKNNNKGFSLVELIIVIALMAILVGVVAPRLVSYLEKSRVSADSQTLNSIYKAVVYGICDPEVLDDPASKVFIDNLNTAKKLEDIPAGSALYKEVVDTLGWTDLNQSTYEALLTSRHDPANTEIYFCYKKSFVNPVAMWITTTDSSGRGDTSETENSNYLAVQKCIVIR